MVRILVLVQHQPLLDVGEPEHELLLLAGAVVQGLRRDRLDAQELLLRGIVSP
jgi:hypothetical protein